jgi:replicative DNA helicase
MNEEPITIPSAHTSEKAVISSILKDATLLKRAAADGIAADSFHHPDTKTLWTACRELPASDNNQYDLIAVVQHLTESGTLDRIGGASQVVECYNYAPTPAGWTQWVSTLKEYQARRMAQSAAREIATADDAAGAIASFRTTLQSLQQVVSGKQRSIDADKASKQFIENLLRDYNSGDLPGMSTGIAELDEICGGMRPGEFWVIAGKPSRGKSVLMLQIASKFISDQRPVAIHSLEMMTHEVIGRLISTMTHTNYGSITQPRSAAKHELQKIQTGVEQISSAPLWIDSSSNQSIDSIAAEAERIRDLHGSLDLVVVDYLQLIRGSRSSRESREEEVARVSGGLKQLAKHLQCPVISASQLNDNNQVRESRAIEQDADALLFIAEDGLKVGKLRNGRRDVVLPLRLNGQYQEFV